MTGFKLKLKEYKTKIAICSFLFVSFLFLIFFSSKKESKNFISISGRIEGDEITISPKVSGRILKVFVSKGDTVKKGELIVLISSDEAKAKVDQAKARLESQKLLLEKAKANVRYWKNRISELKSQLSLTRDDVKREIEISKLRVDEIKHRILGQKAVLKKIKEDYFRYKNLFEKKAVSKRAFDSIKAQYIAKKEELSALQKSYLEAKAILLKAESHKMEIDIKESQLKEAFSMLKKAKAEFEIAKSQVLEAKAALDEALVHLNDTKIYSPIDGIVMEKLVDIGEVVTYGSSLLVLINLFDLHLKGYLPEKEIGMIKYGQRAEVYIDAYPKRVFKAKISKIYKHAEFTPKEVQTKMERTRLVFGVELKVDNRAGLLKPGMPADAKIFLD